MRKIEIRKAKIKDAESYLKMIVNLDKETKFMMNKEFIKRKLNKS